jgi:hypothetical protein
MRNKATADKSTRLTIRLSAKARKWLTAEAKKRGLDEAAFARMLIFERMNGTAAQSRTVRARDMDDPFAPIEQVVTYSQIDRGLEQRELELANEPRAEEFEVPPDADGGNPNAALAQIMAAAPSLLDDAQPRQQPRRRFGTTPRPQPPRNGAVYVGPGSVTRAIGVNPNVAGGNQFGDARGNVLRDNFGHLGFIGTRSR